MLKIEDQKFIQPHNLAAFSKNSTSWFDYAIAARELVQNCAVFRY